MEPRDNYAGSRGDSPKILILCDFDGTVSTTDTVNRLIREHSVSGDWRFHFKRYMRGEVGSKPVYEAVAPHMRMTGEDLDAFVDRAASLDEGFPSFLQWARGLGLDVKIVSDGFDATIHTLLKKNGIEGVEVYANRLSLREGGRVAMDSPFCNPDCAVCGSCKLQVVNRFRPQYDKIILVGDGESDRHAASQVDLVLAIGDLFVYCARQGIPAIRIEGFHEVPHMLTRRVEAVAFDMDGTLVDSLQTIVDAFNHMFEKLGRPTMTVEEVVRKTGISLLDFVKSFLDADEVEKGIKIFRNYYDTIFLDDTKMMPGAMETLEVLDGTVKQGVVTNKRGPYARRLAERLGFATKMLAIIGAEDGFKAKPAADMFDEFVRIVGSNKANTVYVGDAPIDVEAAINAGIDSFITPAEVFSPEELAALGPRRVLRSIADLPEALSPVIDVKS